ncbi:ribbon-helix-helix protein, CopG family [Nocardia sp. NPDC051570]|uniref:ribbon-helix-helix protein, CopG family n=1 Tax=Nocardia sp. NPDC051570 TaxID=3364324 RepID=UPI0037B65774
MRLTVALDHDVARLLEEAVRRGHVSKKEVVNDALRRALSSALEPERRSVLDPNIAAPTLEPERWSVVDLHTLGPPPSMVEPHTDAPALVRAADESDEEAITVALARYFGFAPPAPRLYVVKG